MKKIIACLRIQNDSDIIESLCRYYCSFCDGIIVVDDNSSDNTMEILKALVDEGLPVFVFEGRILRAQQLALAINQYNADLVLPIDADEFLINLNGGSPRMLLESLDENIEYHVTRHNFVYPGNINDDDFLPSRTDKYVDIISKKAIVSRFLLKEKNATAAVGSHWFTYEKDPPQIINHESLCYNHYPVRSENQFMIKMIMCHIRDLSKQFHDGYWSTINWHWKIFFDEIKEKGFVSAESMEKFSKYNMFGIIDDAVLSEKKFDTSFCGDKLKIKYTKNINDPKKFISVLTSQLEKNMISMGSWRQEMERKAAGELLGNANGTIKHLNEYIEKMNKIKPISDYNGTLYIDTGNSFNETETVKFPITREENLFVHEILLPKNIKAIRYDPIEESGCCIQDLSITDNNGNILDYKIINGSKTENNGIVFTTKDPQILINIKDKNIIKIIIKCNIWILS